MILHMENYCLLGFLLIFIISLVGSLARMDFNSTYSLLSYVYLASQKSKSNLGTTLLALILCTVLAIVGDFWALMIQRDAQRAKILGMIIIPIQMILKLVLLALLVAWKFRGQKSNERDLSRIPQRGL